MQCSNGAPVNETSVIPAQQRTHHTNRQQSTLAATSTLPLEAQESNHQQHDNLGCFTSGSKTEQIQNKGSGTFHFKNRSIENNKSTRQGPKQVGSVRQGSRALPRRLWFKNAVTTPSFAIASQDTKNSARFVINKATTSPARKPLDKPQCACPQRSEDKVAPRVRKNKSASRQNERRAPSYQAIRSCNTHNSSHASHDVTRAQLGNKQNSTHLGRCQSR
jgi:hypothetical protein